MNIFCSGIGGIGLSAYAAYQNACGHTVNGSDMGESTLVQDLRSQRINVSSVQDGSSLSTDIDLFVYSLALPENHPERIRARELHIPEQSYFQALGELTNNKRLVAICGTHGKSSTTAMVASILRTSGRDPSVILGTKTPDLDNRNWCKGSENLFVVEACEYRRSFLHLSPDIILLTNITGDHFDVYKNMEDYKNAFYEFLQKLPSDGVLIAHLSDTASAGLAKSVSCKIIDADKQILPRLQVPGLHMRKNAQLALSLADILDMKNSAEHLKKYRGCWRRSEIKGETSGGALVIDDYGHHPNEVRTTLAGLKEEYPDRRLVCVFQPHTHNRTLKLYDEFLTAFFSADLVIIPNIYKARSDLDNEKVDLKKFIKDIANGSSVEVLYGESFENTIQMLKKDMLNKNDLLVTMGAGDVTKIASELTQ